MRFFCWMACVLLVACFSTLASAQASTENPLRQARVMTEAGRFKEAVALLKKYQPQDESEALAIDVMAGRIYLLLDRDASALAYFEQALEQDLDHQDAILGAATACIKLGNFRQARHYLGLIRDSVGESAETVWLDAMMSLQTGDRKAAHARVLNFVQQHPDDPSAVVAYAKFLFQSGERVAATNILEQFNVKHTQAAPTREYLGDVAFLSGNKVYAIKQKQAAYGLYDQQADAFRRDVVAAWLQAQGNAWPESPNPDNLPSKSPPKEVAPLASMNKKATSPETDKQLKQGKPQVLPPANDNDFLPPLQRFPFPDGVAITGGSGFVVDGGRKIVTNRHVIEGGKAFAIRTGLGEVIKAKVIYVSASDDLAVLELDQALPAERSIPADAYAKPRVGRNVVVMGYPLWFILGQGSPSLTNGIVSKRTGMGDDQATFQLTAKVNKGNSGGPVFDMYGQVVGITVGKLDTKKIQEEQGFIPEDVNFAIHVDRLPALINASVPPTQHNAVELSPEELYQVMLGKVVMVATYK